jgi:hypothetical protein
LRPYQKRLLSPPPSDFINNLSTCKSPQQMAGALGKSDWLTAGELLIPAILLTGTVFYLWNLYRFRL